MDIDEAVKRMGIDREFYLELVGDFIEQAAIDLKEIDAAIATGYAGDAIAAAHSVKGAAGALHFTEIADMAQEAEKMAEDGQLNALEEAVRALKLKIEAVNVRSQ